MILSKLLRALFGAYCVCRV